MKILLCHNYYSSRGGEANVFLSEKQLLEAYGHEVIVYTRDNREIDRYNTIKKSQFLFDVFFSLKTYKEIRELIKRTCPDIAHIHNTFPLISPSIYYALKSANVPIVQSIHNYRLLCVNGLFLDNDGLICEKCKKGNYFNAVLKKCYRQSYIQTAFAALILFIHRKLKTYENKIDSFLTATDFTKQNLMEGKLSSKKIVVKPYTINFAKFKGASKFESYAIFAGRLSREKGLFVLCSAFENIKDTTLKIMGSGPAGKEIENFVRSRGLKNIQLLGFLTEKHKYEVLSRAMFLVLPSECYENMPYAILESFACGVPVIASRIGGLSELVTDGYNGLLFESGNAEDLAYKIEKLAKNKELLMEMRKNARKTAEEKFSEEEGYENLMKVYKMTIANKK